MSRKIVCVSLCNYRKMHQLNVVANSQPLYPRFNSNFLFENVKSKDVFCNLDQIVILNFLGMESGCGQILMVIVRISLKFDVSELIPNK